MTVPANGIDVNRAFYGPQYARAWKVRLQYDPVSKKKIALRFLAAAGVRRDRRRVLDIGFGAGLILFGLGPSNALYGVELAESAVADARRRAARRGVSESGFEVYDGRGPVPFPDGFFDLVVCSHVLEHVPDDAFLLAEIRRLLRPGGTALLNVPINDDHYADPHHVRRYSPEGFLGKVAAAGLWPARNRAVDRLWPVFGWFFERRLHRMMGPAGFLISGAVNIYFASIPGAVMELLDRVLNGAILPRQFVVVARKPTPMNHGAHKERGETSHL